MIRNIIYSIMIFIMFLIMTLAIADSICDTMDIRIERADKNKWLIMRAVQEHEADGRK